MACHSIAFHVFTTYGISLIDSLNLHVFEQRMGSVNFDTKVWFHSGIEREGRCQIMFLYKDMYLYITFPGRIYKELLILVTEE